MPASSPMVTPGRLPILPTIVFGLDALLRRQNGVFEYSSSENCILRISRDEAEQRVVLADGTVIEPGDRLLSLHIWNEQMPAVEAGRWLGWAHKVSRCFAQSLWELDAYVESRPEFSNLKAIVADAALATSPRSDQLVRIVERFGFVAAESCRLPKQPTPFHRLGRNMLMLLLVLAANPAAAHSGVLRRTTRRIYLSRKALRRLRARSGPIGGAAWK